MNDKPKFNPNIHHRRSIRLKEYEYSQAGLNFITICCQNRACLFCEITIGADLRVCPNNEQRMILSDAGKLIEKWYYELENKFPDIKYHEMIVMPNHFHCIVENVGSPLHRVVQWFKTMTTNEYIRGVKNLGWIPFNGKLWQRNYYEIIIRNEQSYQTISEYIINNPAKWTLDKFYDK
ncbi:MAG: transposase [Chlorobiota bacterium]|jgi:REP element-mobilizing transposase RayT|nr:transposase [Chlorobiota bacterium]QQS66104.1 MAG: transposase [Chlorobiota bacterium]